MGWDGMGWDGMGWDGWIGRTVADIPDLTARFNSAASTLISSVEQLTQFGPSETSKRSNVIGIFKTKECQEYVAFTFVAQMLRNEVRTVVAWVACTGILLHY
jgi:hypothetical protein